MNRILNYLKKPFLVTLSFGISILIWYIASIIINYSFILPKPGVVFGALWHLLKEASFWQSIGNSVFHIYSGCAVGLLLGLLIGIITVVLPPLDTMLSPIFSVLRATPVACFIVLAWILIERENLPFTLSLIMVAPVMMTATQGGIRATPAPLLEAAKTYHLSFLKKVRTCYLPSAVPHLFTAILNCIGLAWKAGIAAEVITQFSGTIGGEIWDSKSQFDAPRLYAWTLAVIIISLAFEYAFAFATKKIRREAHT